VGPNLQHFNKGRAAAVRIFAMLERKPAISVSAGGQHLEAVSGSISLKAVNFTYPARPDVPVLKNFCLEVPAGK
jgi:ATP-binding cassette subfamily B (MDR/TAP) protein 1